MREIKSSRSSIIWSVFFASIILGAIVHGPKILAHVSDYSGYGDDKAEADYRIVPISIGQTSLQVLVADTEEKRIKGLSHRNSLGPKQGMLFIFDEPGIYGIWMKDMKMSIDIIWVNKDMHVIYVQRGIFPETFPEVFEPDAYALYVLEVPAGFVENNHIEIGAQLVLYR
jgi:uncharacterized membrane protein (UPF0127 family)